MVEIHHTNKTSDTLYIFGGGGLSNSLGAIRVDGDPPTEKPDGLETKFPEPWKPPSTV
jgi:hypothetical protein